MKRLARSVVSLAVLTFALTGCSQITMLRTQEMKAVGTEVQSSVQQQVDSAVVTLSQKNDSLRSELDSAKARLDSAIALLNTASFAQKRMQAEITMLSRRVADESERNDSRQEEIIYRLDLLLGKSDKILAKKVVVSGLPAAPISMDSLEREAEKLVEAEAMFNTARSDYHRGEFKLAFNGFKQVYETMKTGELAEGSLYWMALCLIDVDQKEKAKKVFVNMTEAFPEGQKVCPALFKLSNLYAEECDIGNQKSYLQKILSSKACENSPEFEQAAEILQGILERKDEENDACAQKESLEDEPAAPRAENQENAADAEATVPGEAPVMQQAAPENETADSTTNVQKAPVAQPTVETQSQVPAAP